MKSSVTENGLQWVCPAPVLAGGERCWQNHPVSNFYCQLCQVRQPFPSSCALLAVRMETLCCHLLQRHWALQMKLGTPCLCLGVPGRGESHAEAVQLAVCAQGMQALQSAREMHARCSRSAACLQRSHFTTCTLRTRESLAEGLGLTRRKRTEGCVFV